MWRWSASLPSGRAEVLTYELTLVTVLISEAMSERSYSHPHHQAHQHTMGPLRGTRLPSGRARMREPHTSRTPLPPAEPRYEA